MAFSFDPDTFSALRSRSFRIFIAGQSVSLIGLWMQKMALSWLVYRITESAFKLGLIELLSQAPIIFAGLFAGAWLDRHDIRRTLMATQTLSLLHAAVMAVLLITDSINFYWVVAMSFYFGLVNSVGLPARQSAVIYMVETKHQLKSAIAIHSMIFNLSRLIGPSIAGFIIFYTGESACFIINACAYLAVIYALHIIRFNDRTITAKKQNPLKAMAEGFKYIAEFFPLRIIIIFFIFYASFSYSYAVLFPIFAKDVLHGGARLLGFLMAGIGLGAFLGGLVMASVIKMRQLPMAVGVASLVHIISYTLFALSENMSLSLFLTFPIGIGMVATFISVNTLVQSISADDKRSRVISIYTICNVGFGPIGAFLAGVMAEYTNAEAAAIICTGIMFIGTIILWIFMRVINKRLFPMLARMDAEK